MERLSSYEADRLNDALYGMDEGGAAQAQVSARYVRTDADGTPWVRFEGADKDTPLTSPMSVRVVEGDLIDVSLGGYEATGGGNRTDPSAGFQDVRAVNIEVERIKGKQADFEKVTAKELEADKARIGTLEADHVSTDDLEATNARIGTVEADYLKAADMEAETARVDTLLAGKATVNDLNAATGRITSLESADARITGRLDAAEADIDDLEAEDARIGNLVAGKASINDLNAATGRITVLESTKANIADIEANYITADDIEATYMHADMTNSDVAWIQNGVIANGAISSAMINSLSANKISGGTADFSKMNVANLKAENIEVDKINGQPVTGKSIADALTQHESDISDRVTQSDFDAEVERLQGEIDGAIETWTGTDVPTLNNAPASSWTTASDRDKHVGDVYFNTTSGYNYRFTKSGSTYSWLQIKDTDITNALQRIQTAEGQITQFDSDISTLKTDTGTLTTRTTSLETRADGVDSALLDKVDTTDFNELSDTVDGHTQTLSQHMTAISNKADGSTVSALTTRVSKNEQDISGINTTIGELQTTVASKADGSALTTVSNKLNTVSDTVDGHTQTISSVQSTLATKADGSTVETLTTRVSDVEQDLSGFKTTVSETYATKSEAKQTGSDSGKREIVTEDAAELPLLTLTAYGECQQDGTPTPDAPVEIKAVRGRNLIYGTQFRVGFVENAATMSQTVEDGMYKMVISEGNTSNWNSGWWSVQPDTWSRVENTLSEGDPFTVSFLMRAVGSTAKPTIYLKPGMGYYTMQGTLSEEWSILSYSGTWKDANSMAPHLGWAGVNTASTYYIKAWQIEYGSHAHRIVPRGSIAAVTTGKNLATTNSVSAANIGNLSNELFPGTYTVSLESDGTSGGLNIRLTGETVNLGTIYFSSSTVGVRQSKTFTIDHVGTLAFNGWGLTAYPRDIQLELGTEATDYEPYRECVSYIDLQSEELYGLDGTYYDQLDIDASGHAVITKRTKKLGWDDVVNFSSNSIRVQAYTNANTDVVVPADSEVPALLATHLVPHAWAGTTVPGTAFLNPSNGAIGWNFSPGVASTLAELKALYPDAYSIHPLIESHTIDLGYIDMPTTFDGGTVHVEAEIQPVIDASWWTEAGYETGKAYNDGNGSADLAALTERVTTAESSITQQAGQIALKANAADTYTKAQTDASLTLKANKATLTSEINASADTVKIAADRVNIEGAAIFTSGRLSQSSLDGAYDASGAAAAAQDAANQATDQKLASYSTTSQMNTAIGNAVDAIEVGGAGRWYASHPRDISEVELGYQGADKYVTLDQREDFDRDFAIRVDFTPSETAGRYCLASNYSTLPGVGIELNASYAIRVYSQCGGASNIITDKFVGSAAVIGVRNTFVLWWNHTDKEFSWLHVAGDYRKSGKYAPNVTGDDSYTGKSSNNWIRLGADQRTDSTWNVKYMQSDQPAIWYSTPETEEEYLCFWDLSQTVGGDPTAVSEITCVASATAVGAIESNAVKRTQRIYWRSASSLSSWSMPTAWLTVGNDGSHQFNKWTTKIPRMTANADGTGTKYPYLYTCEQREMGDGTLAYTTVLLDDSATIIDGGSIVTGTIDANKATITNINGANITAGTLTIGQVSNLQSTLNGKASTTDVANAAKRTYVSIRATAIDYAANTATLEATLYIDGTATTANVTYAWLVNGSAISGATSRTYAVPASSGLSHAYSCKCTATI